MISLLLLICASLLIEDVQLQCIRRVVGAKAHSSSSAVEVVSGVYPVGIRKRELCNREFIRILSYGENHPLQQLLECSVRKGLHFCPLQYIQTMSRELERKLKGCKIGSCHILTQEDLIRPLNIMRADCEFTRECDMDNSGSVNEAVEKLSEDTVVVFTDGSVYSGPLGCGACSAVLFPVKQNNEDPQITTKAVGKMVSSQRCETEGILLGIEVAIQYVTDRNFLNCIGSIYLFSDCDNAIDTVTKKVKVCSYPETQDKLHYLCQRLHELSCVVKLVKIPGHRGIYGNELADRNARELAQRISESKESVLSVITVSDARSIATEIAKNSWQRRWNEECKGRQTYEYIPVVGTKILWPKNRDTGISYCRILLNDTMLNRDSHRTGISDTPMCDCGADEETVVHMLFHCNKHEQARTVLNDALEEFSSSSDCKRTISDITTMLLAPPCGSNIRQSHNVILKEALFDFISSIDRKP